MIEKLSFLDASVNCVDYNGFVHNVADSSIINKINELVNAVNGILDYAPLEMAMKAEPADPYVAQRKWVGKLCWYKLCEGDTWKVGRLEKIQENADAGYPFVFDGLCYKICEPVKPDDDIIYKGE